MLGREGEVCGRRLRSRHVSPKFTYILCIYICLNFLLNNTTIAFIIIIIMMFAIIIVVSFFVVEQMPKRIYIVP